MICKEYKKYKTVQKIIALLIESDLTINDQLKVIENVKFRLNFCKETANQMKQITLDI